MWGEKISVCIVFWFIQLILILMLFYVLLSLYILMLFFSIPFYCNILFVFFFRMLIHIFFIIYFRWRMVVWQCSRSLPMLLKNIYPGCLLSNRLLSSSEILSTKLIIVFIIDNWISFNLIYWCFTLLMNWWRIDIQWLKKW